jgi:RimJ/RimL family protein N-acetyltransferase
LGVGLLGMRRGRRVNAEKCVKNRHFVATERLFFRTPTEWEMAAAQAAASDLAAQRWIGWSAEAIVPKTDRARFLAVVPGTGPDCEWPDSACLVAIHRKANRCAGMVTITRDPGGWPELGGWLAPAFRGRGLGVELFRAGLVLGHDHLGLSRIRAAAEMTNMGSRRALYTAGFSTVDGPVTYALQNGRIMTPCWYEHAVTDTQSCSGPRPVTLETATRRPYSRA